MFWDMLWMLLFTKAEKQKQERKMEQKKATR